MNDEDQNKGENPAEPKYEYALPVAPQGKQAADSYPINPYQAPASLPDEPGIQVESGQSAEPGLVFWIVATVLSLLALVMIPFTNGMTLPMLLGLIGGTIRASVIFTRQQKSVRAPIRAELLLITSTVVTLLLMFSVGIAFVTICAGGVLAIGVPYDSTNVPVWSAFCGIVALAAFIFMYVRSMKWGL